MSRPYALVRGLTRFTCLGLICLAGCSNDTAAPTSAPAGKMEPSSGKMEPNGKMDKMEPSSGKMEGDAGKMEPSGKMDKMEPTPDKMEPGGK